MTNCDSNSNSGCTLDNCRVVCRLNQYALAEQDGTTMYCMCVATLSSSILRSELASVCTQTCTNDPTNKCGNLKADPYYYLSAYYSGTVLI